VPAIAASVHASPKEAKKLFIGRLVKQHQHEVLDVLATTANEAELLRYLHACSPAVVDKHLPALLSNTALKLMRFCVHHSDSVVTILENKLQAAATYAERQEAWDYLLVNQLNVLNGSERLRPQQVRYAFFDKQ
jgi:hypothetical protein